LVLLNNLTLLCGFDQSVGKSQNILIFSHTLIEFALTIIYKYGLFGLISDIWMAAK